MLSPMARMMRPCSSAILRDRPPTPRGVEGRLGRLVGDQLDAGDQPDAAHLADQRVVREAAQPACSCGPTVRTWLDDLPLLVDLQRLERHRRGNRMAGIGVAVAEGADLGRLAAIAW